MTSLFYPSVQFFARLELDNNRHFLALLWPANFLWSGQSSSIKKLSQFLVLEKQPFLAKFTQDQKSFLKLLKNGRRRDGILNVFFFKTYSKISKWIFEASFLGGGLAKKMNSTKFCLWVHFFFACPNQVAKALRIEAIVWNLFGSRLFPAAKKLSAYSLSDSNALENQFKIKSNNFCPEIIWILDFFILLITLFWSSSCVNKIASNSLFFQLLKVKNL